MRVTAVGLEYAHPGAAPLYAGLDFEAHAGDLVAVTGPSGSGKSTLLSILGGWLTPTAGVLDQEGVRRLALVPQNPHGVPGRTALDHVSQPLLARGARRRDAERVALGYLDSLHLGHAAEREYRMLSGGERQRMLLARALASDPDLLLVDEPTAQLDMSAANEVCDALAALQRGGVLIFVATHDQRVVAACSSVVDLLDAQPARETTGVDA